jgi:hypothetical protein
MSIAGPLSTQARDVPANMSGHNEVNAIAWKSRIAHHRIARHRPRGSVAIRHGQTRQFNNPDHWRE